MDNDQMKLILNLRNEYKSQNHNVFDLIIYLFSSKKYEVIYCIFKNFTHRVTETGN